MQYARVNLQGLIRDVDPIEINAGPGTAYTDMDNMTPKPGKMQRALGYQWQWAIDETPGAEVGALDDPYWLIYTPQLSQNYWVYAGQATIHAIDEGWNHTDITPLDPINLVGPGGWSGGNLNGICIFNALDNEPHYWHSGLPKALKMPGLRAGTRYNIVRTHKYHCIGMGVIDGTGLFEDALHWSDAADPGAVPQTWVPAAENEAGDNVLADETGKIIDGKSLRDSFFVYKQDAVYEMSYVGGNEVFRFTKVFSSTGALSTNCIARVSGTHVVLGAGDVYQHDGQNYRSLVDGKVKEAIFSVIDSVNFANAYVAYLEAEDKVWICFPTEGNEWPNIAVIWDPQTDSFGMREIPPTSMMAPGVVGPQAVGSTESWDVDDDPWDGDNTAWLQATIKQSDDSLVMADPVNKKFYVANTGTKADGQDYASGVVVSGLDLGDPTVLKGVRRVYPRMNAASDQVFTLRMFGQDAPTDEPLASTELTFTPSREGIAVNINARYIGLELKTQESRQWDISGFDLHHFQRGPF